MIEHHLEVLRRLSAAALQGDLDSLSSSGEELAGLQVNDSLQEAELSLLQQEAARALEMMQAARWGVAATRLMLENHLFSDCLYTYGPDGQLIRLAAAGKVVAKM